MDSFQRKLLRERFERACRLAPEFETLRKRLMKIGGLEIVIPLEEFDAHLDGLVKHGRIFPAAVPRARAKVGLPSQLLHPLEAERQ